MKYEGKMTKDSEDFNIIKPPKGFSMDFQELWQYRELVYIFTWRDVISKYKQTILGFLWVIIQPLSMILLFTFFFSDTLNISTDSIPPPIFYFSGLLIWNFFSAALTNTSNSIISNAHIINKIYFPRIILPMAYVFIAFFDFLIAFVIFIILLICYEFIVPDFEVNYLRFAFYPLAIFLVSLSAFGFGSILASLNVRFRDIRLMTSFIIQFLFFLTPVIYPVSVFESESAQYILALNPAVGAVNLMRSPFVEMPLSFTLILTSTISAIIVFIVGTYLFKKAEYYFADLV